MVQDVQERQLGQFDPEVADYRPVSRMAIVALVTGLASVVALSNPIAWVVPPFAWLFGFWSLRNIRASGNAIAGRWIAIVGILLATFFAASALSNFVVRRNVAKSQARELAEKWVQFIREGAVEYAHQYTLPYVARESPGVPLVGYYDSEEGRDTWAAFIKQEPAGTLMSVESGSEIEFVRQLAYAEAGQNRWVSYVYELQQPDAPPMEFGLIVKRFTDPDTGLHSWTVRPFDPNKKEETSLTPTPLTSR